MMTKSVDVLIIGAGLVGASLAIALKNSGLSIALVEAKPFTHIDKPDFDARSLALSAGSQRIYDTLGLWQDLKAHTTPIEHIHVSCQGRFGATRLESNAEALGHVIEIHHLSRLLHERLDTQANLTVYNPARLECLNDQTGLAELSVDKKRVVLQANLIVAADGANSFCRQLVNLAVKEKDYKQHALVANIGLKRPHQGHAFERFRPTGPLALLPMTKKRAALVWVDSKNSIKSLCQLPEEDFLHQLQIQFGYRLGRFIHCGKRSSFPLMLRYMPEQVSNKLLFIGNAAHALHPIAGQGFNLGLRDAAILAQLLIKKPASTNLLQEYLAHRSSDQHLVMRFTDQLVSLFSSELTPIKFGRDAALILTDTVDVLKNPLKRYAMGLGGRVPDLACHLPLGEPTHA